MKYHRIVGFLYRHWFELKASIDRKADVFFFPIIDILVFGFLTTYVSQGTGTIGVAFGILGGVVFWTLLYNMQRDITMSLLDDAWSRNLFNLYATPLRLSEIIAGTLLLSIIRSLLTTTVIVLLVTSLFRLPLFSLGPYLSLFIFQLFIFGWAFGFFTSGIILRWGTRAQAVAWSLILILYPISGAIYPLSILPDPISLIARAIPVSYIFESIRGFFVQQDSISLQTIGIISVLNAVYLFCALLFYIRGHASAKNRGWFVHPT